LLSARGRCCSFSSRPIERYGVVHHSVAHDFFARSRWSADEVGLRLLDFLIERFVGPNGAIVLAVDGSVFSRSEPKVHGAVWHHDSSAAPGGGFRYGNCFVVVGLVVRIGVLGQRRVVSAGAVALPFLRLTGDVAVYGRQNDEHERQDQ